MSQARSGLPVYTGSPTGPVTPGLAPALGQLVAHPLNGGPEKVGGKMEADDAENHCGRCGYTPG
jgi:hypothetical protein